MANVNFFSPDGGTTRYPIEDTEARSRIAGQQNQLNAQGVLGAKNLLPFPYKDNAATNNGVTYVYNSDNTITANGEATSVSWRTLLEDFSSLELNERYILSGCPSGGSNSSYFMQLTYDDGTEKQYKDYGDGIEFINTNNLVRIQVIVANGYTANNLTFKPMIRLASDPDDTYQPYTMTNRELTEIATQTEVVTLSRNISNTTGADIKLFRYGKLRILTGFIAPTVEDATQADEHPMLASNLSSNDTPQDYARGLLGRMGIIAGIVVVYSDGKVQFTSSTTQNVYFNIAWIAK